MTAFIITIIVLLIGLVLFIIASSHNPDMKLGACEHSSNMCPDCQRFWIKFTHEAKNDK